MRPSVRNVLLGFVFLTTFTRSIPSAFAQQPLSPLPADEPWRYSEVRLGLMAHDVAFAGGVERGVDLNGEITSSSLVDPNWTAGAPLWAQWILHPRAHFGLEPNLNGKTSQLYAGLTWTAILGRDAFRPADDFEFSFLFGPSLNDGEHSPHGPNVKALGSNVLFHIGAEISYRITPRLALGLYFDHSSNGGFARYNASLNDIGLRIGYRF